MRRLLLVALILDLLAAPVAQAQPARRVPLIGIQLTRALMRECRTLAQQLERVPSRESDAAAAERTAYGVLVTWRSRPENPGGAYGVRSAIHRSVALP
jgi:hypothetical protein